MLRNFMFFFFVILLCTCKKSEHVSLEVDKNFEALWKMYKDSTGGGWKNNLNGRFSWDDSYAMDGLIYFYKADAKSIYLEKFVELADVILVSQDKHLNQFDKYRGGKSLSGWGSTRYTEDGSNHIFNVTDAMILSTFVSFYNLVMNSNVEKKYKEKALNYLNTAIEEFEEIQSRDFIYLSNGVGYFQDPYFTANGISMPINQFSRVGTLCIELYKATKDEKYLKYAIMQAKYLKSNLIYQDDFFYWNYYPSLNKSDLPDDLPHSVLTVQFIVNCFESNIVFNEDDIRKLTNLFFLKIYKNNKFSTFINGTGGTWLPDEVGINYFLLLSTYNQDIYKVINEWYIERNFELEKDSFLNHFGDRLILMNGLLKYYKPKKN